MEDSQIVYRESSTVCITALHVTFTILSYDQPRAIRARARDISA